MNSTILESGERCARQEHEAEVITRSHILESSLSIFATSRRCIAHDRAFKGTNTNRRAKMDDRLQLSIVPLARNTPDASQDSWPVIGTQALLPCFALTPGGKSSDVLSLAGYVATLSAAICIIPCVIRLSEAPLVARLSSRQGPHVASENEAPLQVQFMST